MSFDLHFTPAAGFDAPLELLGACHGRVKAQCATLRRLVAHLARVGIDADAREVALKIQRYFDVAAVAHHADEEQDLFPALFESVAGSDATCIRDLTQSLAADHRELEVRWGRLREALDRVAAGEPAALDADEVEAFVALNERHVAREDAELLPMAARLLGDAELAAMGPSMRARRGL